MRKICIVVGHGRSRSGGYDSGAVSRDGRYHEFKIAREIAKYASQSLGCELMNYGGELYLTDRIKAINAADYDFIAEIHLNAGGGTGTETYYYHGSPTGERAAAAISAEIADEFSVPNRGAKIRLGKGGRDYFAIVRDTKPTAVLVETLFIDRESDLGKLRDADGQRRCGEAIARGIAKALGLSDTGFTVRVVCPSLNIRGGSSTAYRPTGYLRYGDEMKIIETDKTGKWGRLADGRGWISLGEKYIRRV